MLRGVLACVMWSLHAAAGACPVDEAPRNADVLLVAQWVGRPAVAFKTEDLAMLPPVRLTQRRIVSSGGSGSAEQSVSYGGVLLRDVLRKAGFDGASDRGARAGIVEAVATDGYRAAFSWGELFNSPAGEQILVIVSQDGKPLDAAEGPLALRALGDLRRGPRHVRNLCALLIRAP